VRSTLGLLVVLGVTLALASAGAATSLAPRQSVEFKVFVHTQLPLGDVAWTGQEFLYVTETLGDIWASDASGGNLRKLIALPREVEEFRCRLSPGVHGWPRDQVFCHAPGNRIFKFDRAGGAYTLFARLPERSRSDGALAFDKVGKFGYALVAATGRSGTGPGGKLYTVRPNGTVRLVTRYPGPGGAENLAIAPRGFGSAAGNALLTIDYEPHEGKLLAIDNRGHVTTLARRLGLGINPIAVIGGTGQPAGTPAPGFYVTETLSTNVFFVAAAELQRFRGTVIVGTEKQGKFWIVRPQGRRFQSIELANDLPVQTYNFEGATWVGS
jgi:hypothetical protein